MFDMISQSRHGDGSHVHHKPPGIGVGVGNAALERAAAQVAALAPPSASNVTSVPRPSVSLQPPQAGGVGGIVGLGQAQSNGQGQGGQSQGEGQRKAL